MVDPREVSAGAEQASGEDAMQMETLTGKKRRTSAGGGGRAAKQAQRKGPGLQSFGQAAAGKQRSDGADTSAGEVAATSSGSSGRVPPTPAAGVV